MKYILNPNFIPKVFNIQHQRSNQFGLRGRDDPMSYAYVSDYLILTLDLRYKIFISPKSHKHPFILFERKSP